MNGFSQNGYVIIWPDVIKLCNEQVPNMSGNSKGLFVLGVLDEFSGQAPSNGQLDVNLSLLDEVKSS